jgi:pimeloyl-ACP methyl ester carboxylesterase
MTQFGISVIPATTLARIAVPTTLIWGEQDRATTVHVARNASTRFGWNLRVIAHAAADTALEQPNAFVKELRAFVAALPRQSTAS